MTLSHLAPSQDGRASLKVTLSCLDAVAILASAPLLIILPVSSRPTVDRIGWTVPLAPSIVARTGRRADYGTFETATRGYRLARGESSIGARFAK